MATPCLHVVPFVNGANFAVGAAVAGPPPFPPDPLQAAPTLPTISVLKSFDPFEAMVLFHCPNAPGGHGPGPPRQNLLGHGRHMLGEVFSPGGPGNGIELMSLAHATLADFNHIIRYAPGDPPSAPAGAAAAAIPDVLFGYIGLRSSTKASMPRSNNGWCEYQPVVGALPRLGRSTKTKCDLGGIPHWGPGATMYLLSLGGGSGNARPNATPITTKAAELVRFTTCGAGVNEVLQNCQTSAEPNTDQAAFGLLALPGAEVIAPPARPRTLTDTVLEKARAYNHRKSFELELCQQPFCRDAPPSAAETWAVRMKVGLFV